MPEPNRPAEALREEVRAHYAGAALEVLNRTASPCCGPTSSEACWTTTPEEAFSSGTWGADRYEPADLAILPADAVAASLGCGNPVAVADLRPGETVLDLGSGGGIDVLLSARRVGQIGRAIGLDMTDEMLELARRNAAEAGVGNAVFLRGSMEAIPLSDASVDVVVSNCVINLAPDKGPVFAEIARVLRPGGRLGVTDVVAEDRLSPAERAERGDHAGCIAGALSFSEYEAGLRGAGLIDVEVMPTHAVADGLHGAIVRATKPGQPAR